MPASARLLGRRPCRLQWAGPPRSSRRNEGKSTPSSAPRLQLRLGILLRQPSQKGHQVFATVRLREVLHAVHLWIVLVASDSAAGFFLATHLSGCAASAWILLDDGVLDPHQEAIVLPALPTRTSATTVSTGSAVHGSVKPQHAPLVITDSLERHQANGTHSCPRQRCRRGPVAWPPLCIRALSLEDSTTENVGDEETPRSPAACRSHRGEAACTSPPACRISFFLIKIIKYKSCISCKTWGYGLGRRKLWACPLPGSGGRRTVSGRSFQSVSTVSDSEVPVTCCCTCHHDCCLEFRAPEIKDLALAIAKRCCSRCHELSVLEVPVRQAWDRHRSRSRMANTSLRISGLKAVILCKTAVFPSVACTSNAGQPSRGFMTEKRARPNCRPS